MLLLLDQSVPIGVRAILDHHTVKTAYELGWSTLRNGELLRAAEDAEFQVILTADTSLPYQQNLEGRSIAIVVLSRNKWSLVEAALPQISAAVDTAKPGTLTIVDVPDKSAD